VVAATGSLQTSTELEQYKSIGRKNSIDRSGRPAMYTPAANTSTKTLHYTATNVPDFAWFAKKDFVIQYDTIQLHSGRTVDAFTYYYDFKGTVWKSSIDYVKDAVHFYSNTIGNYDYPVVQAVEGPKNNSSGGMEYPMVTLITSPDAKAESLDAVITHEVGHNWFMSMLGSNERQHTWLDEGMNSYFQFRYEAEKYRGNMIFGDAIPAAFRKLPVSEFQAAVYRVMANMPIPTAMETPAAEFKSSDDYGLTSYVKPALWMYSLEATIGQEKTDAAFKTYFNDWKHKHPQPADMKNSFEKSIGGKLDGFFNLLSKEGKLE
jgi:aminopeptidase N